MIRVVGFGTDRARENATMSVKPVPDGYHTVTPYMTIKGAAEDRKSVV